MWTISLPDSLHEKALIKMPLSSQADLDLWVEVVHVERWLLSEATNGSGT